MALCLSVCVYHKLGVLSEQLYESCWFLAWELPSTYLTLC